MNNSYRESFEAPSKVSDYEENVFGKGSYGALLWTIEQRWLERFLRRFSDAPESIRYLDFACGTGRVLGFLEQRVGQSRGIDVSPAMLSLARTKVRRSDVRNVDITDSEVAQEGVYDLITSFRFILNAEPPLRVAAMKQLRSRLADDSSRLVVTVQASIPSHRSLSGLVRQLRGRKEVDAHRAPLSRQCVEALASEAGLEVIESFGYDFLSGRSLRVLPYHLVLNLEWLLTKVGAIRGLGGHRIYVLRGL